MDCTLPETGSHSGSLLLAAALAVVGGLLLWRTARRSEQRLYSIAAPLVIAGLFGASAMPGRSVEAELCPPPSTTMPDGPTGSPLVLHVTVTAGNQVQLPLSGTVNVTIDWGAGAPAECPDVATTEGLPSCTYATDGEYVIVVAPGDGPGPWLTAFGFPVANASYVGANKITEVTSFGDLGITNLRRAFYGGGNPTMPASIPAGVTDLSGMFLASSFNRPIGGWDTSAVTSMAGMFQSASAFNQDIGDWDTSAVTSMANMFQNGSVFNQDISGWDTGAVTNMSGMFNRASAFNQALTSWDVTAVTTMSSMFNYATAFNGSLSGWTPSAVTNMSNMFYNATAFNQNIGSWNTGAVTTMLNMFYYATSFNQNIGSWNTGEVTDMSSMFESATSFNQDLSAWCVTKIASKPSAFDFASTSWVKTSRQPVWGTCPGAG